MRKHRRKSISRETLKPITLFSLSKKVSITIPDGTSRSRPPFAHIAMERSVDAQSALSAMNKTIVEIQPGVRSEGPITVAWATSRTRSDNPGDSLPSETAFTVDEERRTSKGRLFTSMEEDDSDQQKPFVRRVDYPSQYPRSAPPSKNKLKLELAGRKLLPKIFSTSIQGLWDVVYRSGRALPRDIGSSISQPWQGWSIKSKELSADRLALTLRVAKESHPNARTTSLSEQSHSGDRSRAGPPRTDQSAESVQANVGAIFQPRSSAHEPRNRVTNEDEDGITERIPLPSNCQGESEPAQKARRALRVTSIKEATAQGKVVLRTT